MPNLLTYDQELAGRLVAEFVAAVHPGAEEVHSCIFRSVEFPDQRQVFLVAVGDAKYALKLDTDSPRTGRLGREYAVLEALHGHFAAIEGADVIRPVYRSPGGMFVVTEYVDRKTAAEVIGEQDAKRAGQAYRRAGKWLDGLHSYGHPGRAAFLPEWMFDTLKVEIGHGPAADPADYMPMIRQLRRDSKPLTWVEDTQVFSHGDFHGGNLILGPGVAYGLDFTEACEKLAVYDIVDLLKGDIFLDGAEDEVDRGGLLRSSREMFFRRYRHAVNPDILNLCLRGRLLIDWLAITPERAASTPFQAEKFTRLKRRLELAFAQEM